MIQKIMNSDDYLYVIEERYKNYKKYRVNAMNSTEGKLIANGNDMSSVIYRNLNLIEQSFNETGMEEQSKDQFFEVYKSFEYAKDYLNRE